MRAVLRGDPSRRPHADHSQANDGRVQAFHRIREAPLDDPSPLSFNPIRFFKGW